MIALLILNILSYIIFYYSQWDIRLNGIPDVNGVCRGKKEFIANNIEIFAISMFVGFAIKHIHDINGNQIKGVKTYFLIMSSLVLFFTKAYIYLGQIIKVQREITKNLYTL